MSRRSSILLKIFVMDLYFTMYKNKNSFDVVEGNTV